MVQLKPDLVASLRPLSKIAFGQELRLPLIVAIGRESEDPFAQSEIVRWLNVPSYSHIERPMESLRRLAAIFLEEPTARGNIWRRRESSLWEYGEELLKGLLDRPGPDQLF